MKEYEHYPYMRLRSNGVWYAYVILEDGTRDIISLRERNKVRAEAKFRKLEEQIHAKIIGLPRIPVSLPFALAAERYLEEGTLDLAETSVERHRWAIAKHLVPYFGRESLTRIGPQRIIDYITGRKRAGAAPNTIHKEKAALSAIFSFLVDREMLPGNPVLAVRKKLKIKLVRPNYAPTIQEVIKILNRISPYSRRFFLCLWSTGARFSEIRRANVGDVNFEEKTIRLVRKGGRTQTVGLNKIALEVIQEELTRRGNPPSSEPLFTNRQGKRMGKIHHALAPACEKAGVPYITHHSLRHSFARTLRRSGYSMQQIGKLLGHESGSSMTVMYADMSDDEVIETAQAVTFAQIEKVIKK
jgi:integrase